MDWSITHTVEVILALRTKLQALRPADRILLILLAIDGPMFRTRWAEIGRYAGVKDTATRALSTSSIRPAEQRLRQAGLVDDIRDRVRCTRDVRTLVLREVASDPSFAHLVNTCGVLQGDPMADVRMAIYRGSSLAVAMLQTAGAESSENANLLGLELLHPFDLAWWKERPEPLRTRLMEHALAALEQSATSYQGPYHWVAARLPSLEEALSPNAWSAFAGVAVLRGDFDALRTAGDWPAAAANVGALARVALAVVEGRYDEAGSLAEACVEPKRGEHAGVLALLYCFALQLKRAKPETRARVLALGARNGAPLQQTFRVAQAVEASDLYGPHAPEPKLARNVGVDVLTFWWLSARRRSADEMSYRGPSLAADLARYAESFASVGYRWLSEQYGFAAASIHEQVPQNRRSGSFPLPKSPLGPALFAARRPRADWEIALDRLELAASSSTGAPAPAASASARIVWRIHLAPAFIDPYLQKRSANGKWTAGRKLALKHLRGKTPQVAALPEEDQRIAAHVREQHRYDYGYAVTEYSLDNRSWLDLVGHPRVHLGQSEQPSRVVRGEVKLRVERNATGLVAKTEPPNLREGVNLHERDGEVVVTLVDGALKGVVSALGASLSVPESAKDRLLGLVERLAPIVPVESTETTAAASVPAHSTPLVRLAPTAEGIAVSLLVRPFGGRGPVLAPGAGAPTLLGRFDGETVQTERDLAAELRGATSVLAECPALADRETGANTFALADPEVCLELVTQLNAMEGRVVVEWPQGKPMRVLGRVGRRALRGRVRESGSLFSFQADLRVSGEVSIELGELLELLAQNPGRFVRLASGEYVELEQELRDVLDGVAAARREKSRDRNEVLVPSSAVSVMDQLTGDGSQLTLDARTAAWRERFDAAWKRVPKVPKGLQGELREYQLEGFRWLARLADLELGACLADDMGLGKTVQLIALLLHRATGGAALVVAPTSVCENWRREIQRFAPSLRVHSYWGADRAGTLRAIGKRDVVVTSYAILQQDAETLHGIEWCTAVLDEGQLIKNADTLRAKAAFGLKAKARIVATGTPVENHAGDIFSLFHFLSPGLLGSWRAFSAAMAERSSNENRARRRLLTPFVLRRTKAQVLDDLPPITEIQRTVIFSPAEAKLYESVRNAALRKLAGGISSPQGRVQVLAELTRLRRLCCHPQLVAPEAGLTSAKLESLMELIEELLLGKHRALVFSQFTDVLALVRPLLDARKIRYQYLDGSTSMKNRSAAVDAFQDGDGDLFLISLKAGGFGLNLTAADYVIHIDPWWNPAVEQQASDRAHRIGQTRPVTVYRLVTAGTVEEAIVELHHRKRDLADAVLADTDQSAKLSATELRALLMGG